MGAQRGWRGVRGRRACQRAVAGRGMVGSSQAWHRAWGLLAVYAERGSAAGEGGWSCFQQFWRLELRVRVVRGPWVVGEGLLSGGTWLTSSEVACGSAGWVIVSASPSPPQADYLLPCGNHLSALSVCLLWSQEAAQGSG